MNETKTAKQITSITVTVRGERFRFASPDVRGQGDEITICLSKRQTLRVAAKLGVAESTSLEIADGNVTLLRLRSWGC